MTDSTSGRFMLSIRKRLHIIIFGADTPAGKAFDIVLIVSIVASVLVVMLDSVPRYHDAYGDIFYGFEWFFTVLFSIEYGLRLWCFQRPLVYARSFFGIVDLLAVIPTYVSLILPGSQYLSVIRVLRVLRIFRILKIVQYVGEANVLMASLHRSRRKIALFLFFVVNLVVVLGSLMYLVEGEAHGFDSIPRSIYWAIVTLTTVGYGDISPQTSLGQALASVIMIIGYAIIAVPTGIITVEMNRAQQRNIRIQPCTRCGAEVHETDARHCRFCGEILVRLPEPTAGTGAASGD